MINILFFAHLRELAGTDSIKIPADNITVVRDFLPVLAQTLPSELIDVLSDESAMVSVNQVYAQWDAPLPDGAEVGLLPPVSGG